MSRVTATPAAPPAEAERHFAQRLTWETDATDVGSAIAGGDTDFVLLDVRSREAYAAGHPVGAISLPYAEIDESALAGLPGGLIVVYCWGPQCNAAQHGARAVAALGRPVKEMLGGWDAYLREGWPVSAEDSAAPAGTLEV